MTVLNLGVHWVIVKDSKKMANSWSGNEHLKASIMFFVNLKRCAWESPLINFTSHQYKLGPQLQNKES